jgi:threonine dehydrogenase-like Zn-dependent dehydrogenase
MQSRAVYFAGNRELDVRLIEVPDPEDDEVQAKSVMNGICMMEVWQYNLPDKNEPFIAGHEGVGIVTKVGKSVSLFKEGDYIYAPKWSEHQNVKASEVIKLHCRPDTVEDFLIEPVSCAVTATAYIQIYPGDRVILFGAGYMGLLLNQLLGKSPLSELIVVDLKEENLRLAHEFGATETLRFGTPEYERRISELEANPLDIAIEASGAASALELCTKLTRKGGKLAIYSWHHHPRTVDTSMWHSRGLKVLNVAPGITANDLPRRQFHAAERLIRAGMVRQSPLLTHRYSLEQAERAMRESTERKDGFIKSVFVFD